MEPQPNGIRKAAILVASLDRSAADRLLDQFEPAQAQQIRQLTIELDPIDPEEQRQVVDEFLRMRPIVPERQPSGIELDGSLAQKLSFSPGKLSAADAREADTSSKRPFRFLHDTEGEKLARLLARERPQTIALVLAHLPPDQAGHVLVRLSAAQQVDVVRRLVDIEEAEPEILREVERALELRFSEQVLVQRRRVAGLSAVKGILKASDEQVGAAILRNLASGDRRLAERLSPERPQFNDLARLDDATLATVFQAADLDLVVLALADAPPEFTERILTWLPEPKPRLFRDRLNHLSPIRLSDIEEARRRIAGLAHQLAVEGHIEVARRQHAFHDLDRHAA
ncbi:MAG: hypothetical protein HQ582_13900 [Planctomycetes bacterium]|nr:hypothetical protein [Planctomycetota bacterium]